MLTVCLPWDLCSLLLSVTVKNWWSYEAATSDDLLCSLMDHPAYILRLLLVLVCLMPITTLLQLCTWWTVCVCVCLYKYTEVKRQHQTASGTKLAKASLVGANTVWLPAASSCSSPVTFSVFAISVAPRDISVAVTVVCCLVTVSALAQSQTFSDGLLG